MPQPVPQTATLPTLSRGDAPVLSWAGNLVKAVGARFAAIGIRLNGSIHKDGEIGMAAPFKLAEYAIADLPPAADYPWTIVAVTDGAAGQQFRGSNGVAWVNLG